MKRYLLFLALIISHVNSFSQCNLLPNALPGLTLVHQNTNCFNNSGVAYNPNLALYYGVRAGNPTFPLETWTSTGTPLYNTSAGFDWRGMWWNPTTNQLEGNGYAASGMWKADLNGSGWALNTGTSIFAGMNQPDAQSCGDLDWQAYEVLYYFNGFIHRYSRTTNAFLGSYPITGTPVALSNLNSTTLMYTGCAGKEIALLDYVNKRVYVYNKANGAYAGMSQLPATAVTTTSFRTSWSNCFVWLFNQPNFTWYSYQIFDACLTCPPIYTNFSYSICNGDSLYLAGAWRFVNGSFNDTLSAANGCDSILVHNLAVLQNITTNQSQSICPGDSLYLGGTWQFSSGIYYDSLTSAAGCDSVIATTLTVLPVLYGNQNISVCNGDSAFLGGAWRYVGGTYYDTLNSSIGCDSILSSVLSILPQMYASQNLTICNGDSILLGGGWQKTPGVYVDTLTAANGCDSILSSTLVVYPISSILKTISICEGDSIFLGGQWRSTPGVYIDTLVAVTGCDSIISSVLSINVLPTINLGNDKTLCEGESLLLDASSASGSYQWQDNSSNPTFLVSQTGSYWVAVSSNNCTRVDTIHVLFNVVPSVDLGPDQSLCPERTVILDVTTSNATYLWQDYSNKPIFSVTKDGQYWVKVSLLNCSASDTVLIDFNFPDCSCPIFIPNAFSPNNDLINDELRLLNTLGVNLKDFRIYNRWGEEVFRTNGLFDAWNGNFKGEPADMGSYYYVVKYRCLFNSKDYVLKGDISLIR
ncbi:MAG: gliding motility-associated C-terminal domain-containing protein [Bacteroidetes bacterium]|nr:gliding motility-associated C-terminal domain-containing protein [Bacteroidota bacterium]